MASTNKPGEDGFKKPMALGSKSRSFIPMTPRSLKTNSEHRNDFARQVAEQSHPRGQDGQPPQKKFRSSAAPKGTRLASGYVDRAQERQKEQDDGSEDKQKRLKALEEMLKLQQIDQVTFEKLRDQIGIGGDTSSTHLVKGLDFKLLERIRRGDDVEKALESEPEEVEVAPEADVEDELEKALEKDVTTVDRPETAEADNVEDEQAPAADNTHQDTPLTRDEILQRLKQNRKKPSDLASPEPSQQEESQARLDQSRFRKLETKPKTGKHKFTETINGRRREVLVITGKDGKTKRKTRWLDPEPDPATVKKGEDNHQAWGGDLPAEVLARQKLAAEEEVARQKAMEEEDDGDIFGGVADYDPLAGLDSDDEEKAGKDSEAKSEVPGDRVNATDSVEADTSSTTANPLKSTSKPRNYFSTTEPADPDTEDPSTKRPTHDPAILAALKRAAQIRQQEDAEATKSSKEDPSDNDAGQTPEGQARNKALLEKLQNQSGYGDDVDVDMGFGGGSRYDDEDDEGDGKQKLSQWKGIRAEGEEEEDEGEDGDKKGGAKRKRGGGGKKRKGDKNSFKDVMSVIEGRKKT